MRSVQGDAAVEGGIKDPVFGSQAVFRAAMAAFAAPGTIADFGSYVSAPPPLVPAAAAFLAALADYDTPVWIADGAGAARDAARWIAFQTGAPITDDPASAAFAVLGPEADAESWERFPVGSAAYPDRSATLLLPVTALSGGAALTLAGPGIEADRRIAPVGLPSGFVAARAANAALFPRGLDILLVCGTRALALPRTTRIREG